MEATTSEEARVMVSTVVAAALAAVRQVMHQATDRPLPKITELNNA
jgi:hypothetical protein